METRRLSREEVTAENTGDGVLLRPAAPFPASSLEEVAGWLKSKHKSKTPGQMRAVIGREMMRRRARGRY